jgi:hypothetical protein
MADVSVRGARPGCSPLGEPVGQCGVGEFAESLLVTCEGDAPVLRVDVVEDKVPDGARAGGVHLGQGDDQAAGGGRGGSLDGVDLVVGERQQVAIAGPSAADPRDVVGEHHALLGAVAKQQSERDQGVVVPVSAQRRQRRCDVGADDFPQVVPIAAQTSRTGSTDPKCIRTLVIDRGRVRASPSAS